jgi:DNA-binding transcriptional MocR family regulator
VAWKRRALLSGAVLMVGRDFSYRGKGSPHLRLGFAALDPRQLDEGVRRMAAALP